MNEVYDFAFNLLSTDDWPPRWFCGKWTSFHGWLTVFSDLFIWFSYFLIPIILIKVVQDKKDLPFSPVFVLFGAFIILCGFTHLLDAIIFWWPAYRLGTFVKLLTAIVSLLTVYSLIKTLPKLLALDTADQENEFKQELQDGQRNNEMDELKKTLLEKDIENEKLKIEIIQLKNRI